MVKVIVQLYPVLRADGPEERKAMRPIGRNRERFQEAMAGMPDIVRAFDDMGVWGLSCIEHHFHSEGYEVGPTIGVHNGYWASLSKRRNIGRSEERRVGDEGVSAGKTRGAASQ